MEQWKAHRLDTPGWRASEAGEGVVVTGTCDHSSHPGKDQSKEKDAPGAMGPLSPDSNKGGRENDQSFHSAPLRLMDL